MMLAGCSSQKNTSTSRWWHSFNARYNTYYNASLAYIDASLEKETGNKDNFTEMIPLYTVTNKDSRELGKSNYNRAIEKCEKAIQLHSIKRRPEWTKNRKKTARDIEWLNRKEYNPFLWKAWMLMGRSQFHSGQFEEATSTFSYMSRLYETQPAIYGRARAWLAKCYMEQDLVYDAEDVIRNMERDSIHWRAQKEWDYTYADYYIHTAQLDKAVPYLRKVIGHEMRRKQKAREWYLMGQIQASLDNKAEAMKAFKHCVRLNPPYELEFNARISMTEVMAGSQAKKMISRLKRMAANDKNSEYLDQVYYAIGNIYLAEKDTAKAISAYEKGNNRATRNGIERGVLLLHLGDLYWQMEKFSDAQRCYGSAIGMLDKDRKDYEQLSERSKILDELVPHTEAVHLQDSLQALAKMSEKDRNAAIDRVIEALKKKEKEEKNKQAEANAAKMQQRNQATGNTRQQINNTTTTNNQNTTWYFYNTTAVAQGKQTFQRQWGKRDNVDNWQRVNKTVVADMGTEEMTDEMRDSLADVAAKEDSAKTRLDSAQNDPHKREYYIAQIPFTEEQVAASNKLLEDALYNSGVIFKDKLDNLRLSEKQLRRLSDNYPDYEHLDNAYYHLFLLYSRKDNSAEANRWLAKLKSDYPESQWTTLLSDPYYKENARFGVHIEDSLYAATYEAFKADRYSQVMTNSRLSKERFPMGANRDKFLFVGGMTKLNNGDANSCIEDMKQLVKEYPESRLSEMAGMIINGVNKGRQLHGAKFDLSDVWNRRSVILNDSDTIATKGFSAERNIEFNFMLAYNPDSVNENQLLFELARYNFTSFMVRNFDISIEDHDGLHRMMVTGFRNYDEALQYARQLYKQENIAKRTAKCRPYVISNTNLALLGRYTYNEYDAFYTKHFAPLKVSTYYLLADPIEIASEKEPEPTQEEIDKKLDDDNFIDNGFDVAPVEDNTVVVPAEENTVVTPTEDNTVVTPTEDDTVVTPTEDNTVVAPVEKKNEDVLTKNSEVTKPNKQEEIKKEKEDKKQENNTTDDNIEIIFDDDMPAATNENSNNNKSQEKKNNNSFDLDDEYYDLEGF